MPGHDNLDAHFRGTLHDGVKVLYLKPQQYAVSVWFVTRIANGSVVVSYIETMQLKD